jgi:hypothetical protein
VQAAKDILLNQTQNLYVFTLRKKAFMNVVTEFVTTAHKNLVASKRALLAATDNTWLHTQTWFSKNLPFLRGATRRLFLFLLSCAHEYSKLAHQPTP